MLCWPCGNHYNGFHFFSALGKAWQAKRGKDKVKFKVWFVWKSTNCWGFFCINLVTYAGSKMVSCLVSKHTWNFLKPVSVQFQLNSIFEFARKTLCLCILCSRNVCRWYHIFYDVRNAPSPFATSLQNSNLISRIIYIRYCCFVVRHYSDIFVLFSIAVSLQSFQYCF